MGRIIGLFLGILITFLYVVGRGLKSSLIYFISINSKSFWIIYLLGQISFISLLFIPRKITHLINSYWQGLMFYFFLLSIAGGLIKLLPIGKTGIKIIDITKIILTIIIFIIGLFNAERIKINNYEVTVNKELPNLNIVLFSDTHLGYQIGYKRIIQITQKINELKPDIVLIPGDIFDGTVNKVKDLDKIAEELKKIKAKFGVYASLGNHDYLKEIDKIKDFCEKSNITLLQDEVITLDFINIIGRNDARPISNNDYKRLTIEELIQKVDNDLPIIMLDHQPSDIENAIASKIDLLVAGHSHNGQVYPGSRITNRIFKVGYGYQRFDNSNIVVTSGVGYWGPPIRIGSVSEIVNIKLNSE